MKCWNAITWWNRSGRDRLPSDRSIDMCISRLRQMLEHDSRAPLLIRTVRHRGYCLAGPVHADG